MRAAPSEPKGIGLEVIFGQIMTIFEDPKGSVLYSVPRETSLAVLMKKNPFRGSVIIRHYYCLSINRLVKTSPASAVHCE